jgi:hypothetical protein
MKKTRVLTIFILFLFCSIGGFVSASANCGILIPDAMEKVDSQPEGINNALKGLSPESAGNLTMRIMDLSHSFRYDEETGIWYGLNKGEQIRIQVIPEQRIIITSTNGSVELQYAGIGREDAAGTKEAGKIEVSGRKVEIIHDSVTEWYLNRDDGIEQGMTISRRPDGTGDLNVIFSLSGDLTPAAEGAELVFSDTYGPVLRYSGLNAWDTNGRDLPSTATLDGNRLLWVIDDRNAVYPVFVDPLVTEEKVLKAPDPENYDNFGESVAVDDYIAVVGAPSMSPGGTARGQVFLFYKDLGGFNNWGYYKSLTASDSSNNSNFGYSVGLYYSTLIVGAPYANAEGTDYGQAYIFERNQGGANNWGEVKILKASDRANYDQFGYSVDTTSDFAVVGANRANSNGTDRGQAYIFGRDRGGADNWGEVKKLKASDQANSDLFGQAVAISGNFTLVGAPYADSGGTNRGQAYVFERNQGGVDNWGEVKKLKASDQADNDYFGWSVSMNYDYLLVGAPYADSGGTDRGKAYAIYKDMGGTGNWGELKVIAAPDQEDNDNFGYSVAMTNYEYVVGAPFADSGGFNRGKIYVFSKHLGGPNNFGLRSIRTATDAVDDDQFGHVMDVSTYGSLAIVGAPRADSGGINRGEAHILDLEPNTKIGITNGVDWYRDMNGDGLYNAGTDHVTYGGAGWTPVIGSWDSTGKSRIGVTNGVDWYIDVNGDGTYSPATEHKSWGALGWTPVVGDWDGTGTTKLGVTNGVDWYIDVNGDGTYSPATEHKSWGALGWTPVVGDWDGTGTTKLGVTNGVDWYIDVNGDGTYSPATEHKSWGALGWTPVVGQWGTTLTTKLGVTNGVDWYIDMNGDYTYSAATEHKLWGAPGWTPVVGEWSGFGYTALGVTNGVDWYLDNGDGIYDPAHEHMVYGAAGWTPVTGKW